MWRKLNRIFYFYLLKELLYIFLLSLGILTFILVLSKIGRLADLVINKGVDLKDIIFLIVYSSPPYLTFTLPMAFLLSTIVVLGRLSADNEILALKASGVNLKHLFLPILGAGLVITCLGLANSTTVLSKSGDLFRNTLLNIVKKGISIEDKEGIFNDTIPGVVIYVDKVDTEHRFLSGILVSDDRSQGIRQTISARRGIINVDPVTLDLHFVLEDGNLHRWEKADDAYRSVSFRNYTFSMNLASMLPQAGALRKRPYEMNVGELKKALAQANESDRYDLLLEMYKKVTLPLSTLTFILFTVPLGIKRETEGRFSGAVYSLLVFVFYYVLMALTENVGKSIHLPALLTAFAPNVTISIIGLHLLRGLNKEDQTTVWEKLRYFLGRSFEKAK